MKFSLKFLTKVIVNQYIFSRRSKLNNLLTKGSPSITKMNFTILSDLYNNKSIFQSYYEVDINQTWVYV